MTPELILAAVKSGFDFGTELLKFWQTPEGQQWIKQTLSDRAKWDSFWADAAKGISSFFKGDLFK